MSTFIFPQYREASFKANGSSWKFSQQENACIDNMVEAGFSLMPSATTKDTVMCYYCQIEFTGWEADSDPFFLHLRKSPDCCWALCACLPRISTEKIKAIEEGLLDLFHPLRTLARIKTFDEHWPHAEKKTNKFSIEKLAKSGFYFTPSSESKDAVTCFSCQSVLEEWTSDDKPIEAHIYSNPNCEYIMNLPENLHKLQLINPKTNLKLIQEAKGEHSFLFSDSDMSFLSLESFGDITDQKRRSSRILQKDAEAVRAKLESRRNKLKTKFKSLGVPLSLDNGSTEPESHHVAKEGFKFSASRRLTMKPTQRLEHTPDSTESPTKEEAPTIPDNQFELAIPPLTYSLRAKQKRAAETDSSSSDDDVDRHSSTTTRKSAGILALPSETESKTKPSDKITKTHENNFRKKLQQPTKKLIRKTNTSISPINDVPSPTSALYAIQSQQSSSKTPVGPLVAMYGIKEQVANKATGVSSNQSHASTIASKNVADVSIEMADDQLDKASPEILSAPDKPTLGYYSPMLDSSLHVPPAKDTDSNDSALNRLANINKPENPPEPTQLEEHSLKLSYLTPQEKRMSFGGYIRKLTQDHIQYLEEMKKLKLDQLDDLLAQFNHEQGL